MAHYQVMLVGKRVEHLMRLPIGPFLLLVLCKDYEQLFDRSQSGSLGPLLAYSTIGIKINFLPTTQHY